MHQPSSGWLRTPPLGPTPQLARVFGLLLLQRDNLNNEKSFARSLIFKELNHVLVLKAEAISSISS